MFCAHHPCIIYQHVIIICTHLHKALCLYISSYFKSHMIFFFIHVHISDFVRYHEKLTPYIRLIQCVYIWVSTMILLRFFPPQCERNKCPCRNQWSPLWRIRTTLCQTVPAKWTIRLKLLSKLKDVFGTHIYLQIGRIYGGREIWWPCNPLYIMHH